MIEGSTALVTGANRGIGAEFVRELRKRGARRVYAASRTSGVSRTSGISRTPGITRTDAEHHRSAGEEQPAVVSDLLLDVTDPRQIEQAAVRADDVDLLINNAGVASGQNLVDGDLSSIRHEVEVDVFGPLALSRAFAPVLASNGGGTILNVLSAAAWFASPGATAYAMAKAAAWAMTDGLRVELAAQGTHVASLVMAVVDTDMTRGMSVPKLSPATLVTRALDGLDAGTTEILADELSVSVKEGLSLSPDERYADLLARP